MPDMRVDKVTGFIEFTRTEQENEIIQNSETIDKMSKEIEELKSMILSMKGEEKKGKGSKKDDSSK